MRAATSQGADRFEGMNDRDIEELIRGGIPTNAELIPLRAILAELRSLAHRTVSESFIELHVTEAAELAAAQHVKASGPRLADRGRRVVNGARRRTATAAAALTMFASATGVALASDDAVPGDWDYGIDRALEVVGIGVGGESERLHELQVLEGVDVAAVRSNERSARVTDLLTYLKDAESVDGSSVSEIASNGAGKPEDPGGSGRANKPEDPGAAGSAGQPEDPGASGRANKPEEPGATGGAVEPDDPGASGRANKPEEPGATGGAVEPEDPGGSGNANEPEEPGATGGVVEPEDPGGAGSANQPEDAGAAGSAVQAEDPGGADNPKKTQTP